MYGSKWTRRYQSHYRIANAYIDCVPVVAVGGSSPFKAYGRQVFQEIDQLGMMKPCTKWAERVYSLARIPEMVNVAFQKAIKYNVRSSYFG